MSEQLGEANGFAHAYSTWISQGNGLDTKRDGVFRYKAGPMKGMTRDQAQMHFQNKVWANASPEWKNEYAQRATSDLLAPSEQSDLEKRKAFASGVTQPQYKSSTGNVTPMQGDGVATPQPAITPQGPPAPAPVAVTPPKPKPQPADIMKADYSTLTPEQKAQRTQANVDRVKAKATSMGMPEEMPAMSVTAPRMKPLETKYDMEQGRVVQTGGDADQAFSDYDKAQNAARAGTATAQQRQTVVDYVSQDVLGRQPGQIAKQREDERKGYYQAGRYVGPSQPVVAAPRMPVSAPVFASGGKRSNPAPVATRQPSFGNRAGTGATRMPI